MPIIKSAIKRAKQSITRRHRNLHVKRAIKQDTTAVRSAIAAGDAKDIQEKLNAAYSELDRAVKKHTLHKNTAARRKSVLAHAVAKATGSEVTPAETKTTKGAGKKAVTTKSQTKKTTPAKAPAKKTAPKKSPLQSKLPLKRPRNQTSSN